MSKSSNGDLVHDPIQYVIDASVGVKLFLEDPLSETVHQLFEQLTLDPPAEFYVPDLFYIEVTNVLWKYVRWQGMNPQHAEEYLDELSQITLMIIPTSELMVDALRLAKNHQISAYDACYLALSNRLNTSLITADQKLANTLNQPERVKLLGQNK